LLPPLRPLRLLRLLLLQQRSLGLLVLLVEFSLVPVVDFQLPRLPPPLLPPLLSPLRPSPR